MQDDGEVARRDDGHVRKREPFVPDPRRVVYPVDHHASQRAALAKFDAEVRIVVGAQLTNRIVDEACDLEDKVRARAHDNVHYTQLEVALTTFMADAIEVRHRYMHPDDDQRSWQ